ncbi:MAG TPA: lipoprotein [Dokdonella sp.]
MSASRPLLRCLVPVLAALLAACGNKGPLYKPTPPAPAQPAPPAPAPPSPPVPTQGDVGH